MCIRPAEKAYHHDRQITAYGQYHADNVTAVIYRRHDTYLPTLAQPRSV